MYRRTGRGRLLLIGFLALAVVVITLDFRQGPGGPLEEAREISTAIVAPIQRGLTTVFRPVGNFFSSLADLSSLRSDNEELRSELEDIHAEISEAESLKEENARLRDELGVSESWVTMDRVAASVIGTVPANYDWAVYIDKGRADGIKKDMAVVNSEGLVGKVIDTESNVSTVLLLIDPGANARARIVDAGFTGIAGGHGLSDRLSLDLVDTDADVEVGDDVVTSGFDRGIFPPSIPIGQVVSASGEGAELSQEIELQPWVDFTSLDVLQVITETGSKIPAEEEE